MPQRVVPVWLIVHGLGSRLCVHLELGVVDEELLVCAVFFIRRFVPFMVIITGPNTSHELLVIEPNVENLSR